MAILVKLIKTSVCFNFSQRRWIFGAAERTECFKTSILFCFNSALSIQIQTFYTTAAAAAVTICHNQLAATTPPP
jgi:hypothetical protein